MGDDCEHHWGATPEGAVVCLKCGYEYVYIMPEPPTIQLVDDRPEPGPKRSCDPDPLGLAHQDDEWPEPRERPIIVDFFSGLGGFSSGFHGPGDNGVEWEVVTVELEERFEPTVCIDIMALLPDQLPFRPELLVASPPCQAFSHLALWKYWKDQRPSYAAVKSIGLVAKTFWLIERVQPTFWVVENPRGYLRKVIGLPTTTQWWGSWGKPYPKPTDLWAKFPPSLKLRGEPKNLTDTVVGHSQDASVRSLIPEEFSHALRNAVEHDLGLAGR